MESNHVRDLMEAYSSIYTENEEVEQLDEFAPGLQGPVDNFLKGGQKVLKGLGLKVNEKERPTPDQNAQKAKINQNQNQSFDLFDIIKGHLLDEGFADTEEAALAIMTNMSEEWKQSIVEAIDIPRPRPTKYIAPSRPLPAPAATTPKPDMSTQKDKEIGRRISQTPIGMRLTGPTGPLR